MQWSVHFGTRRSLPVLVGVLALATIAGCSRKKSDAPLPVLSQLMAMRTANGPGGGGARYSTSAIHAPSTPGGVDLSATPASMDTTERQLIRNANVTLEVASVDTAIARLTALTDRLGGYVSSQDRNELDDHRLRGSMELRIPATRLTGALAGIEALGKVKNERVWVEDVTEQYYDLGIRLKNAQEARDQLQKLLARAKDVKDVLDVQTALTKVTTDIERMTGQMRRLTNRIAYSTVSVTLEEPLPVTQQPNTAIGKLSAGLRDMVKIFWSTIADIIRFVGFAVPMAILLAFVIWVVVRLSRRWRRRRRERRSASES